MFGKINLRIILFILFFTVYNSNSESSQREDRDNEFMILACTRPIGDKPSGLPTAEHCYLKLVQNEKVVDSRGFFQDAGSVQEPHRYVHEGNCKTVKMSADISGWYKIIESYGENEAKDYNLTSRNCCTVAKEALETSGINVPKNIENANCSIGTTSKFNRKIVTSFRDS